MTKIEQLQKFIKDNKLKFNSGSGGDSNILALTGYACYIEASQEEVVQVANSNDSEIDDEIKRIYNYALMHNYKKFWTTEDAKKQYKF
jgi:hypothetical protein